MDEEKPIGPGLAFVLIAFGIMVDVVQVVLAILLVGELLDPIIDLIASFIINLLLYHHDPKVMRRRRASTIITTVLEFIPFVDALPLWTIDMVYIVVMDKMRHRSGSNELPPPRIRL